MKSSYKLFAAAGLVAVSAFTSQAQPYVAGDFNGWNSSASPMSGSPAGYSYVVAPGTGVPGSVDQFKILQTGGSWNVTFPPNNVWTLFDSTGGNTFYYQPGPFSDGWYPLEDRVGYADPGNVSFELVGEFNGWGGTPTPMVPKANGVYTNTYVIPAAGTYNFKFRTPGTWDEAQVGTDFGEYTGNASVTTTTPNQPVLFQLDLPNGRYQALVLPPVTNQVVFAVDMISQIRIGAFNPATDSVFVSGDFNGSAGVWPGTGPGALLLTNRPSYTGDGDTNIYYGTNTFAGSPGTVPTNYKFTDNDPSLAGSNGYEQGGNRSFALLTSSGLLRLPVVSFGNYDASEYLPADTAVLFSVDMNNAFGTDDHAFDPVNDSVYINGQFVNWYAWSAAAPEGYQMIKRGSTTIYTNTIVIPSGTPVAFAYKYGMDPGNYYGGPVDDEAGFQANHFRVVRSTALNPYPMPTDKFGSQYGEPYFSAGSTGGGNLTVGTPVGGKVPVSWLGRPGAHLQVRTNLSSGAWQDISATDGTNWVSGSSSTNGFVSQTNWPAGGNSFFRLFKR